MLSLGCEIEFFTPELDSKPEARGFEIHREYYPHMWEINSFLTRASTVPKLVDALVEYVTRVVDTLGVHDPLYAYARPIHKGLAFTGVHLHIQDTDHMPVSRAQAHKTAKTVGEVAMTNIARNRGLSARQVFSHHIWGNYRTSTTTWKRNARFKPCLFNQTYETFELRAIDVDQLLPTNRRKLTALLKAAFLAVAGEAPPINKKLMNMLYTLPMDFNTTSVPRRPDEVEDAELEEHPGEAYHSSVRTDTIKVATTALKAMRVHMFYTYTSSGRPRAGIIQIPETSYMANYEPQSAGVSYCVGSDVTPVRQTPVTMPRSVGVTYRLARRQATLRDEQAMRREAAEAEAMCREAAEAEAIRWDVFAGAVGPPSEEEDSLHTACSVAPVEEPPTVEPQCLMVDQACIALYRLCEAGVIVPDQLMQDIQATGAAHIVLITVLRRLLADYSTLLNALIDTGISPSSTRARVDRTIERCKKAHRITMFYNFVRRYSVVGYGRDLFAGSATLRQYMNNMLAVKNRIEPVRHRVLGEIRCYDIHPGRE